LQGCACNDAALLFYLSAIDLAREKDLNVIGRLRGTLAEKQPPHLILDVNGLGYEVEVPMTTLYRLPSIGEPLTRYSNLWPDNDGY